MQECIEFEMQIKKKIPDVIAFVKRKMVEEKMVSYCSNDKDAIEQFGWWCSQYLDIDEAKGFIHGYNDTHMSYDNIYILKDFVRDIHKNIPEAEFSGWFEKNNDDFGTEIIIDFKIKKGKLEFSEEDDASKDNNEINEEDDASEDNNEINESFRTIEFGEYYKSSDSVKEPIEWIVLEEQADKLLLISKYAIDCQKYHHTVIDDVTWETSSLRHWLNETFLNSAFTCEEQNRIAETIVSADKNPYFETPAGNNTIDKVFLLSVLEVNKYLTSDRARQCQATEYAKAQGVYSFTDKGDCIWWLRSPASNTYCASAANVNYDGDIYKSSASVDYRLSAVRPALWINL